MPGSAYPTAKAGVAGRPLVLVLANDFSLTAAKRSRHLALALNRLGYNAVVRDTRLTRWAASEIASESAARREAYETAAVAKWSKLVEDYGIDYVIGVDLHWLVSSRLFLDPADRVKQVHSLWFDEVGSQLRGIARFPLDAGEVMNAPKVTHHCQGDGQAEELRLLGVTRIKRAAPAAPEEYLKAEGPCEHRDRMAFAGDPGLPSAPSASALAAMDRGASLAELRALSRQEVLDEMPATEVTAGWLREMPTSRDLMATAMERRLGCAADGGGFTAGAGRAGLPGSIRFSPSRRPRSRCREAGQAGEPVRSGGIGVPLVETGLAGRVRNTGAMEAVWNRGAADGAVSATGFALPELRRASQRGELGARRGDGRAAFRDRGVRADLAQS